MRNGYTKYVADKVGWPVNWWPDVSDKPNLGHLVGPLNLDISTSAMQLYEILCVSGINSAVHGTILLMTNGCVRTRHHCAVSSVLHGLVL